MMIILPGREGDDYVSDERARCASIKEKGSFNNIKSNN